MIANIDIGHKELAEHFENEFASKKSALTSFKKMRENFIYGKSKVWKAWVKAYNFDMMIEEMEDVDTMVAKAIEAKVRKIIDEKDKKDE